MAKFTPRPWEFYLNSNGDYEVHIGNIRVVLVETTYEDDDNVEQDANLIAAAPDMYEALEYACSELCHPECNKKTCSGCKIQHAITKAEGRR